MLTKKKTYVDICLTVLKAKKWRAIFLNYYRPFGWWKKGFECIVNGHRAELMTTNELVPVDYR